MPPPPLLPPAGLHSRRGFTLMGAAASLALLAAAAAVCVPLIARRLSSRAPAVEEASRRVDAAVTRGLESVGALADAYAASAAAIRPPAREPAAASLPDGPVRLPLYPIDPWDDPLDPPFPRWGLRPFLGKPVFPRPTPWAFYRHPLWRARGRYRK